MMAAANVPQPLRVAAQREADAVLADVSGVVAVVIATTDGFDIASAATRAFDPARIAALASSISAIGEVVSGEAGLGPARSVTIETETGFALAHCVHRRDLPMVIKVLAGPGAVLAQAKYRAAAAARSMASA